MRGTLIALRTGGAMAQGGGAPAVLRVVPVDAFTAYVIAPHDELGAVAWELVYGNGDNPADQTPADSIGAPFGGWRLAGIRALPDVMANPETEATETIYSGIGSQGIAVNVALVGGGTSYAGDYHGGKSNSVQTGSDPRSAAMTALFEMIENYTINWPDGAEGPRVGSVTSSLRIDATAAFTNTNRFVGNFDTLTVALSLLMAGSDFTRASIDQGATWTDISTNGSYAPVDVDEVWFRKPTTGTIVKAVDNARAASNFKEKYWDRNNDRVKLRSRFDTVETAEPDSDWFGDQTCVVTYSLATSEPDPLPTWMPFTDSFDAANPSQAGSPLDWTRISAPAPDSDVSGGAWTVTGIASTIQRFVRNDPLPPGTYHLEVDYSTAAAYSAGGVKIAITPDGSSTGAIVGTSSFNSDVPTTKTLDFVVAAGQLAYITFEASTSAGREWTATELRLTGTPD